jgi:putative aldouronate transport system substrate-binding protein
MSLVLLSITEKKLAGPNALDSSGKPAVIETMPLPETDPYFNNNRLPGFPAISPTAITSSVDQDPKAPKGAGHEVVLYRATARMEPYKVPMKNVIPNFYYLSEENEKISSYKATINPYIEESIARFVTGDLNLKKDWDNYLKELDSLGLKDYLAIVQDGYDRWKATSKQ